MLTRFTHLSFFLDLSETMIARAEAAAKRAAERAEGMTHHRDYEALAAVALCFQPRRIFEIGTYRGVTSDFFLSLLPESRVVSIAYENPRLRIFGGHSNNSELGRTEIGSMVSSENRPRFTQLYGNSHKLDSKSLRRECGPFDLVFVDGDHSRMGVAADTVLAQEVLASGGTICWHDANPKPAYLEVRHFLENELSLPAAATADDFVGGVACWNSEIERRLAQNRSAVA